MKASLATVTHTRVAKVMPRSPTLYGMLLVLEGEPRQLLSMHGLQMKSNSFATGTSTLSDTWTCVGDFADID
jgi:hypothetical protein